MLLVDTTSMSSVTNTIALREAHQVSQDSRLVPRCPTDVTYIDAHIQRLANPVTWDTTGPSKSTLADSVDVASSGTAIVVHVACETGLVQRVTDEEDTLDGVEVGASQHGEGVDGGGRALGVAFEEEAFVGVGLEGALDFADDLRGGMC